MYSLVATSVGSVAVTVVVAIIVVIAVIVRIKISMDFSARGRADREASRRQ
jgi:hypothetical protein